MKQIYQVLDVRRLALLALCCGLAGCATDDDPAYQAAIRAPGAVEPRLVTLYIPTPVPAAKPETSPLDYYAWAQTAPPDELYAEHLRLSAPEPDANALVDKVHLGILMSVSAIASPDSEREAFAVLESIDVANVDETSRDYAAFAAFLLNYLEQRAELRAATSDAVTSREALEALQRNNAQLQQKIDALTKIEEQIIEREQAEREQ